jgi:hypothetical protein
MFIQLSWPTPRVAPGEISHRVGKSSLIQEPLSRKLLNCSAARCSHTTLPPSSLRSALTTDSAARRPSTSISTACTLQHASCRSTFSSVQFRSTRVSLQRNDNTSTGLTLFLPKSSPRTLFHYYRTFNLFLVTFRVQPMYTMPQHRPNLLFHLLPPILRL